MKIPDDAPRMLVCMRFADMQRVHPDQSWELCHKCNHTVGVYPSGQKALDRWPHTKIICVHCATPDDFDITMPAAETYEEYLAESRDSKPVVDQ